MKRKTWMVGAAALCVVMLALPGLTAEKQKYEEKFEKTLSLASGGGVELINVSGNVDVGTWSGREVKIDALKVSKADSMEEAKKNADLVTIEISEDGNVLKIETKYPKESKKGLNVSIQYKLTVPAEAAVNIKTVSGNITMAKIGGAARANAVSGDLMLDDMAAGIKANSVSGNITLMKAVGGADCETVSGILKVMDVGGDAFLKTVSGNITAERIKGSVNAEAVSGDIDLMEIKGAKTVDVQVLSGNVVFEGGLESGGRYDFQTHNGSIRLTLPSGSAFDLDARTFNGKVNTDFDITVSGKLSGKSLRGRANGGGAAVNIKTFNGTVNLKKN